MMITNSMDPHEESELVSLVEDYANEIRAWDKKQIGARPHLARQDIIDYVGSLLAAKDAEIARLQANQMPSDFEEMYALYVRDEERGDPALRDMRFAGYASAFFTRFLRLMHPDWK
jgi:hypothetical protein